MNNLDNDFRDDSSIKRDFFATTVCVNCALIYLKEYIGKTRQNISENIILSPNKDSLESILLNNTGNLQIAFSLSLMFHAGAVLTIDSLHNYSSKKLGKSNYITKSLEYLANDDRRTALASGILSSSAVVMFETTGILNTPDWKDIPAGILGAGLYVGLRYLSSEVFRKYSKENYKKNNLST